MRVAEGDIPVCRSSVDVAGEASTARPEATMLKRDQPIHAGDADRREEFTDRGRIVTRSAINGDRVRSSRNVDWRCPRASPYHRDQEDQGEPGEQ